MEELFTKKQITQKLKRSTRQFDRDVKDGRFPAGIKLGEGKGGAVRWPKSVVEKWIADRMVG